MNELVKSYIGKEVIVWAGTSSGVTGTATKIEENWLEVEDKDGNKHQITHGSYIPLMQGEDRELRKSAFKNLYSTYTGFENSYTADPTYDRAIQIYEIYVDKGMEADGTYTEEIKRDYGF